MREQSIQTSISNLLREEGWIVYNTMKVVPNGYPDLIAHRDGMTVLLEVKTPSGRVSGIQKETHRRLREQGIIVLVVKSKDEVIECLKTIGV